MTFENTFYLLSYSNTSCKSIEEKRIEEYSSRFFIRFYFMSKNINFSNINVKKKEIHKRSNIYLSN